MSRGCLWSLIGALLLFIGYPFLLIGWVVFLSVERSRRVVPDDVLVNTVVSDCGLAELPVPPHDVNVGTLANLTWRKIFIRFQSTPDDINNWLNRSPAIKYFSYVDLHNDKKLLPYSEIEERSRRMDNEHLGYHEEERLSWWTPTIRVQGRMYERSTNGWYCAIIIDDIDNTVFLRYVRE